jgi:hypothetical protein
VDRGVDVPERIFGLPGVLETFGIIAPDAAKKPPVSNEAGSQS